MKSNNVAPLRKAVPCPSCKTDSNRDYYPFCSKRCQDVDMHRWFSGSYALAEADLAGDNEMDEFGDHQI